LSVFSGIFLDMGQGSFKAAPRGKMHTYQRVHASSYGKGREAATTRNHGVLHRMPRSTFVAAVFRPPSIRAKTPMAQ
jgi:hypothetical protein